MANIKGIYFQEIFNNPSNGYTVGLLRVKESSNEVAVGKVITFTGIFDELKFNIVYNFEGEFLNHSKYGMQFSVTSYELILPTEEDEIVEFLSSDLFPIGEITAKKIVERFGKDSITTILNNPNSLLLIPRLSQKKIDKIHTVLSEYQETSHIVLELSKMGFNTKNAITILKKYGNNTINIVNNNIYNLQSDIDIPFIELDKIARNNGYALNDERRLEALTINLMNIVTFNNGNTYLSLEELSHEISKYTDNLSQEEFEYILLKLEKLQKIIIKNDRYYLKEFYDAEHYIANRLLKLTSIKKRKLPKLEIRIKALEESSGITYDYSQKEAIKAAVSNNLTIITGGPGTGKTTIIKCIVSLLINLYQINPTKIALLAPTGRAARKLSETTGIPAYTIHKYLGWDKEKNEFSINEFNPNKEEYIIVDESSMIDTLLLSSLLKGTTNFAKYIFVGDYYQLPSVSQGQVLKDMIDSEILDVIKLNCLYRQSEGSYIINLAQEVKNQNIRENFMDKTDDYSFIPCNSENIMKNIEDIVNKAKSIGYSEKDIQVLAPLYKTINGIDALNKTLQQILNPPSKNKKEITSGATIYREGDKILQLVNDPDNGVSNGDLGYIESINIKDKKNELIINFDNTRVTYTPKDFINITHGYAISIHKSQGGEFKLVIIPFAKEYKRMLYNKLIYTAITRAKEKLILLGDPNAFLYGIHNNYIDARKTTILELLKNEYNN